jgi:hypothetical protein
LKESEDKFIKKMLLLMLIIYLIEMLFPLTNIDLFYRLSYAVTFIIPLICIKFLIVKTRNSRLVLLLIFYLVILLIIGILNQNWSSYILFDLKSFLLLLIFLVPFNENTLKFITTKLPNTMAGWLYISLPVSWYFILTMGLQPGSDGLRLAVSNNSNGFGFENTYTFIEFSVLLLPFITILKGFKKIIVIASAGTFFLVSFFTITRGATLLCIISFILMSYMLSKSSKNKEKYKIFILFAVLFILILQIYESYKIYNSFSYFVERMTTEENFTSYRSEEQYDFFTDSSITEIIFGRGLGGAHEFGIWKNTTLKHGINMTHYGYLFFVLKGGIILLIAIYGLAILSMIKLWKYGGIYKSFSIVIFLYLFYEISITKFFDPIFMFLPLISIFLAKNLPKFNKQNKILLLKERNYSKGLKN